MRRLILSVLVLFIFSSPYQARSEAYQLRYAHMNSPDSVTGIQATLFADKVREITNGEVNIQVFPSSLLGNLWEMVDQVQTGVVDVHHNTMAGIGSIFEPLSILDTPFLHDDVEHLMRIVNVETSPVMKSLNRKLIKEKGVRILYNFYFGTRHLTCDRPIYHPKDLKGLKIRAIPFPIYVAAVEGLGAVATPVNWSEVPAALKTGFVNGQENPVDVIFNNKLYKLQSHLMLTGHIKAAESVVINEKIWQKFPRHIQTKILKVAGEVSSIATRMTLEKEALNLSRLKEAGMIVIGDKQGLDREAFRKLTKSIIAKRFGHKYGEIYRQIKDIK